jgi:hypothetical protein
MIVITARLPRLEQWDDGGAKMRGFFAAVYRLGCFKSFLPCRQRCVVQCFIGGNVHAKTLAHIAVMVDMGDCYLVVGRLTYLVHVNLGIEYGARQGLVDARACNWNRLNLHSARHASMSTCGPKTTDVIGSDGLCYRAATPTHEVGAADQPKNISCEVADDAIDDGRVVKPWARIRLHLLYGAGHSVLQCQKMMQQNLGLARVAQAGFVS